jgi:hypothetical protein
MQTIFEFKYVSTLSIFLKVLIFRCLIFIVNVKKGLKPLYNLFIFSIFRQTSFLIVSNATGVAIKIEEYVPIIIPIVIANTKPLRTVPPKINSIKSVNIVVRAVFKVLRRV